MLKAAMTIGQSSVNEQDHRHSTQPHVQQLHEMPDWDFPDKRMAAMLRIACSTEEGIGVKLNPRADR